jgi:hypothetical protein
LVDVCRADWAYNTVITPEATTAALPIESASARVRPPDENTDIFNSPSDC